MRATGSISSSWKQMNKNYEALRHAVFSISLPSLLSQMKKSSKQLLLKLHQYRTILKLIWIYGIQLWGTVSTSNIEILESFQSNTVIRKDLQIPTVKEEIRRYSSQYSARLSAHSNDLIVNPIELPDNRRLRRHQPNDLPTRFLV
jgi:hypothetical protein